MFNGFGQLIHQGGAVMIILILMSIIAVAIVIERLVFFANERGDTKALLRALGQRIAVRRHPGRDRALPQEQRDAAPHSRVRLQRGTKNRADITDALSIALMENLNLLERNLGVIGTIAVIAPFVGLLGTVLGIIRAFQDIALQGQFDACGRRGRRR